ncbi:hypothetical protein OOJ91_12270 [Micromonospora lupini]|uniref:SGNH/GDSL hydrolase family protein n=1 Tax=Micromonospora lupini TaxID=285679 RepID=UPI002258A096|nr:hypothetical protein [Micromonospora lupini]MCX5066654.1 hypothetical protein [Micromonospora lupini]
MARLIGPDEAYRTVYLPDGTARAQGYPVPLFTDEGLSEPADVRTLDGDTIAGSVVHVDVYSRVPLVLYPDGEDVVWTSIQGGPPTPLFARLDGRLDALVADLAGQDGLVAEERDARVAADDELSDRVDAVQTSLTSGQSTTTAALAALPTTYTGVGGNIQATLRRLQDDVGDVTVLVLGDGAAAGAGQWPYLLAAQVQALYPHRTLKQTVWNGTAYPALSTITAGTGSGNINWYQGAVTSTNPEHTFFAWDPQVAAVQPDLIITHFGHGYGATASGGGFANDAEQDRITRERLTRWVAQVKVSCSAADVIVTSQNPYLAVGARTGLSTLRAQIWRDIAADMGCAYGPILEAYQGVGTPAAYLAGDGVTPTTSGSTNGAALAAAALLPLFRYQRHLAPSPRVPSPLLRRNRSLLVNGDFSSFTSPPTLPGWTALNSTLSKNTTTYESGSGYSLRIAAAAGSGLATIYQLLPIYSVRGQVITCAARIYLPAASSNTGGRLQLSGDTGVATAASGTLFQVRDRWVWAYVTGRIPATANFATLSIIGGTAGSSDECYVDRVVCVLGHLPSDV